MQKHIKVYTQYFNTHSNYYPCEVCNKQAVDIHHIIPRSKFGKKTKDQQDKIENLIALCRPCHEDAHANKLTKEHLQQIHLKNLY